MEPSFAEDGDKLPNQYGLYDMHGFSGAVLS